MQHQNLTPVAPQERIQAIDIIRGFALFGILIINFTVDSPGPVAPWDNWRGLGDQIVYWFVTFFLDDRFMAIYCFLFGFGFALQMQRAENRNSPFLILYIRRLIALYIIGTIHHILTLESILPTYALMGFLLLFVRKLSLRLILLLAVISLLGSWFWRTIVDLKNAPDLKIKSANQFNMDSTKLKEHIGVYEISPGRRTIFTFESGKLMGEGRGGKLPVTALSETDFIATNGARFSFHTDSSELITGFILHTFDKQNLSARKIDISIEQAQKEMIEQRTAFQQQTRANQRSNDSTYVRFVIVNTKQYWTNLKNGKWWVNFFMLHMWSVFPLFLLGLYAGRKNIFYDIEANKVFWSKLMFWGLLLGMIGIFANNLKDAWDYFRFGKQATYSIIEQSFIRFSWHISIILAAMGYVATVVILLQKESWKKKLSFLAPVGRMGLTNYILHTIPIAILFRNFGFGLIYKIGCFYRFLLALPFIFLIYFLSHWWFKHFRIGPFEWLWRSLTYLKFQPMRIKKE